MIKAIIFDFYGVVCSEIGSPWYQSISSSADVSHLKQAFDVPSNLGEISEKEFFTGIGKAIGKEGEQVRDDWVQAAEINTSLVDFICRLKSKYKIAVCSNTQPELFRELLQKYRLEDLFDVVVSSSEVGMMKPGLEIFRHTLAELEVKPEEVLFIDDRVANVEGTEKVGIVSILYEDLDKLEVELASRLDL